MRLSGDAARVASIAEAIAGTTLVPRQATLATFRDASGAPIDQGIAILFAAPASYTGETVVELHGHGSPAAMRLLLARCVALGARLAEPGEFTRRAFLNGKLDLAQAESVADLIAAGSATAARAAARSLTGAFSREVDAIVEAVTQLRMFTEATLDFPEEDVEFVRASDAARKLATLRADVDALLARAATGAKLGAGLAVVLVGRPNVGKSSLMNRLARDDVAIVADLPGTTRDTVERAVEVGGIPLTVIDTAGLRDTGDTVERLGIERTWAAVERADLALVLVDARETGDGITAEDRAILARLPASLPRIVVHNKADLAARARAHLARGSRRARLDLGAHRRGRGRGRARDPRRSPASPARARTRSSPASAISRRSAAPRRTSPRPLRTSRRSSPRSSSTPRSCARRRTRSPRSPASSPRTTCSASSSRASASASSRAAKRLQWADPRRCRWSRPDTPARSSSRRSRPWRSAPLPRRRRR